MSSDSEVDEFYDAEEATPPVNFRSRPGLIANTRIQEEPTDELEEIRKNARLKLNEGLDEEAENIANEKIFNESDESLKRAVENEKRRKKLEEMRERMTEEGSPLKPPPKPPRLLLDAEVANTEEEVLTVDPSGVATMNVETAKDESKNLEVEIKKDVKAKEEEEKEKDPESVQEEKSHNPADFTSEDANINSRLSASPTSDYSKRDSDIDKEAKIEPDIVQSTKPKEAPPPRPVAPPRKKKSKPAPPRPPPPQRLKSRESGTEETVSEASTSTAKPPSKGLPTELAKGPSPTSTVLSITKELECSLSLHTATSGKRMVTAIEEVSTKAAKTEEEKEEEIAGKVVPTVIATAQEDDSLPKEDVTEKSDKEVDEEKEKSDSMRPRSNSGSRFLTDEEILAQVTVLNLDTGEKILLSQAEEKLPRCVNPLSLHIMRRTKEYSRRDLWLLAEAEKDSSDSSLRKHHGSDDEGSKGATSSATQTIRAIKPATRRKAHKMKKMLSKGFTNLKTAAKDILHGHDNADDDDDEFDERSMIKIKAASAHKGPYDFDLLVPVQDFKGEQNGAIWTMKFSHCGRLLATGGQDNLLRVWVLKDANAYFEEMRQKYSEASKVSPTPSQDSLSSQTSEASGQSEAQAAADEEEDEHAPFARKPFCVYRGHTADLLDLSWSKNYFILSSSMDKTVRLWHVSRKECLCCFQHIDFVTAIAFHPRDDRYFLSGSLDGKMRLWSIPDKKVALWNEVLGHSKLITAASFCLGGKFAVCGTYDGRCIFYTTEQLKYFTQIHVRSTRGKNARGRKITGIESLPGEDKILVTSNDSRIRIYDLRDLTLTCKYKGCANNSSQIKASFSHDGKYIICGSEDHFIYIWRTQHDLSKFTSTRRDRSVFWEGIKAHHAVVTVAIFAPNPSLIIKQQFEYVDSDSRERTPQVRGEVLVSADFSGSMKIFINKFKPGSGA